MLWYQNPINIILVIVFLVLLGYLIKYIWDKI